MLEDFEMIFVLILLVVDVLYLLRLISVSLSF